MTRAAIALAALLVLAACGGRVALKPAAGNTVPPKAETAAAAPTPEQLMTADSQARPKRSDEQLKRSEERREDKFDLPPS
jgi:ABC-type glycerol-3-phosphate transport system substrate-binding protein